MAWDHAALPGVVLFDLDDTIIDLSGGAPVALRQACDEAAARDPLLDPAALLEAVMGEAIWFWSDPERHRRGRADTRAASREIVARALERVGQRAEPEAVAVIAARIRELHDASVEVIAGAVATLESLAARGVTLGLVTNGTSVEQRAKIERFALAPHFAYIGVEGEVGVGKPELQAYETALQALGSRAEDTWMVGDNLEWDVAAPQRLGIRAVWVDGPGAGLPDGSSVSPDRTVRTIAELAARA